MNSGLNILIFFALLLIASSAIAETSYSVPSNHSVSNPRFTTDLMFLRTGRHHLIVYSNRFGGYYHGVQSDSTISPSVLISERSVSLPLRVPCPVYNCVPVKMVVD